MFCGISISSALQRRPSCGFFLLSPGEKAAVCQTSDLRLWANWKHQDSGRINKKRLRDAAFREKQNKTRDKSERVFDRMGGKQPRFRGMSEDGEDVGVNKASLQSACCCFCLTQSSHEHFIRIKERVCTFTGSLTTLSSFSHLPEGRPPTSYDIILTRGHKISSLL